MKTVVHVCKRAPTVRDLKHNYRGRATRSKPERYFQESRVWDVIGETRGVGVVPRGPGKEKSLLQLLSGPNAKREGKPLRQLILSAEDVPPGKPDGYYAMVLAALLKAAKKWVDKYAPGCRWAAWAHEDRAHPHVHVVVENWDYARGKRLNLSPTLLEEMQGMEFCTDLGIESGRGSRGQIEAGLVLLADGKREADCSYQERIQIQSATKDNARMAVAAQIENWRKELNLPPDVEAMQVALEEGNLPSGWTARTRSHKGARYKKPSVIIDGVSVRLNKFLEMRERLPSLASPAHIPDSTVLESVIAEPVMIAPFVEEPTPKLATEPALVGPALAESVVAESVAAEPVVVDSLIAESVVVDTAPEVMPEPQPKSLVNALPVPTSKSSSNTAAAPLVESMPEPVAVDTVVAKPVVAEPVAPKPEVAEPMVAKSEATPEPAALEPKPLPVTEPMPAPGLAPEPKPVPLSPSRRRIRRSSEPEMGF